MAETILSYLLAELESSNPQRISKKMGGLGSGEDGISLIPCGSGMENGKVTRLKCPGRCIRKKPGCGRPVLPSASSEALGQVPGDPEKTRLRPSGITISFI